MVAAKGVASVLEVLSELTNILKLFLSASPQWGAISLDVKYNGIALECLLFLSRIWKFPSPTFPYLRLDNAFEEMLQLMPHKFDGVQLGRFLMHLAPHYLVFFEGIVS